MSTRFDYAGAPVPLQGSEDTSAIESGSDNARKSFTKNYIPTGYTEAPLSESGKTGRSSLYGNRGGADGGDEPKKVVNLSVGQQILLAIVIIVVIVLGVLLKDALFGKDSKSSTTAAPEQQSSYSADAGGSADSGKAPAAQQQTSDFSATDVPPALADTADTCITYDVSTYFYSPEGNNVDAAPGYNCNPKPEVASGVNAILFTDDANTLAAARDGKAIIPETNLGVESSRGSTLRAQNSGAYIVVTEVLPNDEGVASYLLAGNDDGAAKEALKRLGVAK